MNIIPSTAVPYIVLFGAFLYNLNIGKKKFEGKLKYFPYPALRNKGNNVSYRDVAFIYELTIITLGIFMLVGNIVQKRLVERITILACSLMTFLAFYLSSVYALSYILLCIFMGFFYAVGYGICFTIPLSCAYKHFKNNRGFISGIIISAISLSPFLYCPLQTMLINKNNVSPVQKKINNSTEYYFDDKDVLNRVPNVLFLQSIIFLIFATMGGFLATMEVKMDNDPEIKKQKKNLLSEEKNSNTNNVDKNIVDLEKNEEGYVATDKHKYNTNTDSNNIDIKNDNSRSAKSMKKKKKRKFGFGFMNDDKNNNDDNDSKQKGNSLFGMLTLDRIFTDNYIGKYYNKKCTEDKFFFLLWISVVLFNCYINFVIMYWKIIGINYTHVEDKLITLNGSFINSLSNIAGRIIWGIIYDKIKINYTIFLLGICIIFCCFILPIISHVYIYYALVCALFYFCIGGSLVTIPVITLKKYGETHFSLNMSILYTSRIANTFLCSIIVSSFYKMLQLRYLSYAFGIISSVSTLLMCILTK
ncbi:membrane transporter [Plasmodium falciparum IGH-CR14]|uniref:Membrane transporter n=1 Tax=Plasmodium falciparum IGH-CR14 TaxID=580059 RepID=A0A0L1IB53_PLAFA|nr:membrane transporter [Plasmodium falciparum IGH-CR14]